MPKQPTPIPSPDPETGDPRAQQRADVDGLSTERNAAPQDPTPPEPDPEPDPSPEPSPEPGAVSVAETTTPPAESAEPTGSAESSEPVDAPDVDMTELVMAYSENTGKASPMSRLMAQMSGLVVLDDVSTHGQDGAPRGVTDRDGKPVESTDGEPGLVLIAE